MLKRNLYKVFLFAVFALASCNSIMDDENVVSNDDMSRSVMFTLTIDDAPRHTRAAWSEEYIKEVGTEFDSRISLSGLQVFFYTADNRYIGEVTSLMHWPEAGNSYRFAGEITDLPLTVGATYKIMVVANNPGYATNIEGMYYSMHDIAYPNGYIPMWGVGKLVLTSDELQNIGDIALLRAAAKIEVQLSQALIAEGYTLDAVTINHYNMYGYCAPNGWDVADITEAVDQENCLRAYHSHETGALPLNEIVADKGFSLYIPEFNVLHTATNRPRLSVTLGDGTSTPLVFADAIHFGKYNEDGLPVDGEGMYNIVRNHIYRFTISGISRGLEIEYEVAPWDETDTWDRGVLEYPTYHNPIVPDYLAASAPITISPEMTYNNIDPEAGAFSAWFKMSAPAGQAWNVAHDKADTDYQVVVYDEAGNNVPEAQWVASDNWYNIKIIPLNPENAGDYLSFGITYHPSWMPISESMYLMINGKADEIAWPNSGNDPKIIKILQK